MPPLLVVEDCAAALASDRNGTIYCSFEKDVRRLVPE